MFLADKVRKKYNIQAPLPGGAGGGFGIHLSPAVPFTK